MRFGSSADSSPVAAACSRTSCSVLSESRCRTRATRLLQTSDLDQLHFHALRAHYLTRSHRGRARFTPGSPRHYLLGCPRSLADHPCGYLLTHCYAQPKQLQDMRRSSPLRYVRTCQLLRPRYHASADCAPASAPAAPARPMTRCHRPVCPPSCSSHPRQSR